MSASGDETALAAAEGIAAGTRAAKVLRQSCARLFLHPVLALALARNGGSLVGAPLVRGAVGEAAADAVVGEVMSGIDDVVRPRTLVERSR